MQRGFLLFDASVNETTTVTAVGCTDLTREGIEPNPGWGQCALLSCGKEIEDSKHSAARRMRRNIIWDLGSACAASISPCTGDALTHSRDACSSVTRL